VVAPLVVLSGCPEPTEDDDSSEIVMPSLSPRDSDEDGVVSCDTRLLGPRGHKEQCDCNDRNDTVYPGADEVCDGLDNNCDDQVDEGHPSATWYADADADGYGAQGTGIAACAWPGSGYVPDPDDCDDADAAVHPGATEVPYDGIDQDCDDEDLTDVDGDGYPADNAGGDDCNDDDVNTYPGAVEFEDDKDNDCNGLIDENLDTTDDDGDGYTEADGDCNDANPYAFPGAGETPYDGIDQDCFGTDLTDVDGDGFDGGPAGNDCHDADATVYPDADEVCDGVDNDCDGQVDDNGAIDAPTWYQDADVDGYGAVGSGVTTCQSPYSIAVRNVDGDCNDADVAINPGAQEIPYDGIDQDCDGADLTDVDGDGYASNATDGGMDCDDNNTAINPGATEVCGNSVDENCDGTYCSGRDADGDGHGTKDNPTPDCNDADATVFPGALELCDSKDNNCNGQIDEGVEHTYYQDSDTDGYGNVNQPYSSGCVPAGYVTDNTDCDDNNPGVYPGAVEIHNDGIDQDCSGADYIDADADGFLVEVDCDDNDPDIYPGADETPYDGIDQDCNGSDLNDLDGDGYSQDPWGTGSDCDDKNPSLNPAAEEIGDGIDNNCNDQIDEGTYAYDDDGDGYSEANGDCDDANLYIFPGAGETPYDGIDQDCDGADLTDVDGDGFTATEAGGGDCEDNDPAINPYATEVCDGVDNNCDGEIDEGVKTTWYLDEDGDGYAISEGGVTYTGCTVPDESGQWILTTGDCDDANANINPNATEVCDEADNDCDGAIDEWVTVTFYQDGDGDGYGTSTTIQACTRPGGYAVVSGDCDDTYVGTYPGASEQCDGMDNDCDGVVDDDVKIWTWYRDADGDEYGTLGSTTSGCAAPTGYVGNSSDCNDDDPDINPVAIEVCDSADNDCDGNTDEGVTTTYYKDNDGDGHGTDNTIQACSRPAGYATVSGDCDDRDASVPRAETCDSADNDCDGSIDEGVKITYYQDNDGDGYGSTTTAQACNKPSGYATVGGDCNDNNSAVHPGATEVYDGLDNDCDGQTDEGLYATNCLNRLEVYPASSTGTYTIDVDGVGGSAPISVYCDMTTDGGGWTLLVNIASELGAIDLFTYTVGSSPSISSNYGVGMSRLQVSTATEYRLTCMETQSAERRFFVKGLDPSQPVFKAAGSFDHSGITCSQSANFSSPLSGNSCFAGGWEDSSHTYYGNSGWGIAWALFSAQAPNTLRHCATFGDANPVFHPGRVWAR